MHWARVLGAIAFAAAIGGCGSVRGPDTLSAASAETLSVTVTSPTPVALVRHDATHDVTLCTSPCETTVAPSTAVLSVEPAGLPASPRFGLPPSARGFVLEVDPASEPMLGAGATASVLGLGAMVVGGVVLGLDQTGREGFEGGTVGGAILLPGGAALVAAGITLAALGGTDVTIREAARRASEVARDGVAVRF